MNGSLEKETHLDFGEELLSIEVTSHCNIECLHCFVHGERPKRSSLSLDVVKGIIVEGHSEGYRHLHITGGEPLLWKGLYEALDYAFYSGYETVLINSNGILLSREACSKFSEHNGLLISVSLEGSEAIHNSIRGEGSHRMTVQGIEKALDRGIKLVIFTTAYKCFLPELPRFAGDLYERFPSIKYLTLIQLMRIKDSPFSLSDELLEPKDFLRLVQIASLLNLLGLRTDILNDPLVNVVSKQLKMPWLRRSPPMNRAGSIIIMADGNMRLSHFSQDTFGKYRPGMIRKVVSSGAYRKFVAPDEKTCPSCQYAELCKASGMVQPSESGGSLYSKVPYCRRVLDQIAA